MHFSAGSVDVESSGAPKANFREGLDTVNNGGDVIGAEPNEFYPLEKDGVIGWISICHIELGTAAGGIFASEPIDDTYPIN